MPIRPVNNIINAYKTKNQSTKKLEAYQNLKGRKNSQISISIFQWSPMLRVRETRSIVHLVLDMP